MALPVARQSPWRDMSKLRFFKVVLGLSVVVWLISVGLISARVVPLIYPKSAVPLHYNIHVGVDSVGPWWQIYTVPAIGLAIVLINLWLAKFMWTRDPVLAYIAGAATLTLQIMLLLATTFIVFLSLAYAWWFCHHKNFNPLNHGLWSGVYLDASSDSFFV